MKAQRIVQLMTIMICFTVSLWGCSGGSITISIGSPTILSASPSDGATNVGVNVTIGVIFSEAMDPSTITPTTLIIRSPDFIIAGRVSNSISSDEEFPGSTVATFTPLGALRFSTSYTVTMTTDAKNLAGIPLETDHTWTFTTEPAPK